MRRTYLPHSTDLGKGEIHKWFNRQWWECIHHIHTIPSTIFHQTFPPGRKAFFRLALVQFPTCDAWWWQCRTHQISTLLGSYITETIVFQTRTALFIILDCITTRIPSTRGSFTRGSHLLFKRTIFFFVSLFTKKNIIIPLLFLHGHDQHHKNHTKCDVGEKQSVKEVGAPTPER